MGIFSKKTDVSPDYLELVSTQLSKIFTKEFLDQLIETGVDNKCGSISIDLYCFPKLGADFKVSQDFKYNIDGMNDVYDVGHVPPEEDCCILIVSGVCFVSEEIKLSQKDVKRLSFGKFIEEYCKKHHRIEFPTFKIIDITIKEKYYEIMNLNYFTEFPNPENKKIKMQELYLGFDLIMKNE